MASEEGILNSYRELSIAGYYTPTYPPPPLVVAAFLNSFTEEAWTECYNMFTQITSSINVGDFNACSIICSISNGKVFYDSRSESTYQKFKEGTIAPNQNKRPGFIQVLSQASETSYETILNEYTLEKEYSIITRIGSEVEPMGIVAFTISFQDKTKGT